MRRCRWGRSGSVRRPAGGDGGDGSRPCPSVGVGAWRSTVAHLIDRRCFLPVVDADIGAAGIVARFPEALKETFTYVKNALIEPLNALVLLAILLGVVAVIIFFEQAQRRIPVQYAKRLVGKRT